MLWLSIKLSNENKLYGPKTSQRVIHTQLSAVEESILYDYPWVIGYKLEINLMKCQNI